MRKEAKNWYDGSLVDIREAEDALKAGRPNWALFAAHQSVEKAIKAGIMIRSKKRPSRTHDLTELLDESKMSLGREFRDALSELTPYYSSSRYPNAGLERPWESISLGLASRLVTAARQVVEEFGKELGLKD